MAWVFQALVIVLTAALWWAARRDLTARAAEVRAPAAEDWIRLRMTVEQLMVELEKRAVVAEQRIYEAEQRLRAVNERLHEALARADATPDLPHPMPPSPSVAAPALPAAPISDPPPLLISAPLTAPLLMPETDTSPLPVPSVPGTASAPLPVTGSGAAPAATDFPVPPRLTPEEARYLPIHALADSGETDAAAIARLTGLPRGEVELVLSLRARRSG